MGKATLKSNVDVASIDDFCPKVTRIKLHNDLLKNNANKGLKAEKTNCSDEDKKHLKLMKN